MKILKKHKSGLIFHEIFTGDLNSNIKVGGVIEKTSSSVILHNGEIYFDIYDYKNCVIEVENNYIPQNYDDMGGIRIKRGNEKIEFFEFYDETSEPFSRIKVIKKDDEYFGKGTNDNEYWIDGGNVTFCNAEQAGIAVIGTTPYEIKSISVYKDEFIYIYSVLDGWELKYNGTTIAIAERGEIKAILPYYPFNGTLQIYNGETLVCESNIIDGWGGDEYECTFNIDILSEEETIIPTEDTIYLGELLNGYILKKYFVRNNDTDNVEITVKISEFSPFYDWVWLSKESIDPIYFNSYEKAINFSLAPYQQEEFYLFIKKPDTTIEYDYKNKDCVFFLEVV